MEHEVIRLNFSRGLASLVALMYQIPDPTQDFVIVMLLLSTASTP